MHPAYGALAQFQIAQQQTLASQLRPVSTSSSTGIPLFAYMGIGALVTVGIWAAFIR